MRVGLYARVSTDEQHTLPMQLEALNQYVQHRGWIIKFAVEDVGSGASERPQREQLLKAARKREADAILVWRLDRWGRSLADLVITLKELQDFAGRVCLANRSLGFNHRYRQNYGRVTGGIC